MIRIRFFLAEDVITDIRHRGKLRNFSPDVTLSASAFATRNRHARRNYVALVIYVRRRRGVPTEHLSKPKVTNARYDATYIVNYDNRFSLSLSSPFSYDRTRRKNETVVPRDREIASRGRISQARGRKRNCANVNPCIPSHPNCRECDTYSVLLKELRKEFRFRADAIILLVARLRR